MSSILLRTFPFPFCILTQVNNFCQAAFGKISWFSFNKKYFKTLTTASIRFSFNRYKLNIHNFLSDLSQHDFYKLLLTELGETSQKIADQELLSTINKRLKALSEKWEKIVIIFSRFDQLKAQFDWNFLSNIQSLVGVAPGKITLIFTSVKSLAEIAPDALKGGNLNFYSPTDRIHQNKYAGKAAC